MNPLRSVSARIAMLRRLAFRPLTMVDLTADDLKLVQDLVRRGLARDHAAFHGRRTPVHLRIWGIAPAGKALLEQQSLVESSTRKQQLSLVVNPPAEAKPKVRVTSRIKPFIRDPKEPPF